MHDMKQERLNLFLHCLWFLLLCAGNVYADDAYTSYLKSSLVTAGKIINTLAILGGVFLTLRGLFLLKKYGQMRTMMSHQLTLTRPLMMLLCGGILTILPTFIDTSLRSFWGDNYYSNLASMGGGPIWDAIMDPVFMFIRLLGVIAFIRAISYATKAANVQGGQGFAGKALTHFIAGILCVNVDGTAKILAKLLDFADIA